VRLWLAVDNIGLHLKARSKDEVRGETRGKIKRKGERGKYGGNNEELREESE